MKKYYWNLTLASALMALLLFCGSVGAKPVKSQPNTLGQTIFFEKTDSFNKLEVTFWQPSKGLSQTKLPLLVLLDGQRYFAYATSMHHMMQQFNWAPPFAILGINIDEGRWGTYMDQREELLRTLSSEVFPYLEEKYKVSQQRLLFGWEAAGGFTLRTLVDKPSLFDSFIAASPSPLYGEYFPMYKDDYQKMIAALSNKKLKKHLYLSQANYDYPQYLGIRKLVEGLSKSSGPDLRWTFEQISDASHSSIGFESLMKGVRDYFYYYDTPEFDSYQDFEEKGGFSYLDKYFLSQANDYGFDKEKIEENRFEAWRELSFFPIMDNDREAFQEFLKTLSSTDFLARSHMNHIYAYAKFLMRHKDMDGAKKLLIYIKKRHPDQARPIYGLGLVAQLEGRHSEAHKLLTQAVEMAEKNRDFRLEEYRLSLKNLEL